MNGKRIIALIAALAIPVLYIITIILFIIGNDYANLFLAVSLGGTFFLTPVIYLLTRVPKEIGEVSGNIADMMQKDREDKED